MKKSAGLYLSAREASAELAISQATLYAYVSRGLIRSEPSEDSRSHRYRAEDVRTLKERRTPAPEPRGMRSFDADLPVIDSAVATITEDGPIYRGVNCVDLAERDTLEHAATLLWDVTGVDPFEQDNCPVVSDEMRNVADAARGANAIDRAIAVLALTGFIDSLRESRDLARSGRDLPWFQRPLWRGSFIASIWFAVVLAITLGAQWGTLQHYFNQLLTTQDPQALLQQMTEAQQASGFNISAFVLGAVEKILQPLVGIAFVVVYLESKLQLSSDAEPIVRTDEGDTVR